MRGVTLIETLVATGILIIVVAGVLPVFTLGFQTTEQAGDLATRTTEYAQDKMESLIKLDFNDAATDTTVFPAATSGGSGLGGAMAANASVGAVPPTAPASTYADYLDFNGTLLTSSTGAYYTRQWKISTGSSTTLKTITVVVSSLHAAGIKGAAPSTTLVSIKSGGL
jgi:type II secretory pathway pseudopilin PulG